MIGRDADLEANSESDAKEVDDLLQPAAAGKQEADSGEHNDLSEEQARYDAILKKSLDKVKIVMGVTLIRPLMVTTRWYIMESYMASLSSSNSSESNTTSFVSTLIFVGFALSAIQTFGAAWFGDKYGHDKSLFIVFILNAIGVLLESIASYGQLWLFTVGYFFTGFAPIPITMAYIAYVLPHKHAIRYMSLFFTSCSIVYLFGPFLASLIAQNMSYRSVFWFNTYVFAGCVLIDIAFVWGSQSKLQSAQNSLSEHYVQQQEKDDIFPVCQVHVQNNANADIDTETDDSSSWSAFFRDIGQIELVLLIISTLSNCLVWTIEVVYLFYFALFFMDRYHVSLMYTTSMFFVMTVCYGVTALLIPRIIDRVMPKHIYIVSVSSLAFFVLQTLPTLPPSIIDMNIVVFWLMMPFWGSLFGAMHISTEMCILEVQPKQHSGKVTGAKEAIKITCRALGILLVGNFWTAPLFNSMCVVNGMCALIVFMFSFCVWWFGRQLK